MGDTISLGGKDFTVIGIASSPIGTASDVYVKLATLQTIAGFKDQISAIQVRATSAGDVSAVASSIGASFAGSQVTTAADLAARVGGSLEDTRDLSSTLGRVLVIVGLVAAVLIASLLTLASVSKRVRELGDAEGARLVAGRPRASDLWGIADPGPTGRHRRRGRRGHRVPRDQRRRMDAPGERLGHGHGGHRRRRRTARRPVRAGAGGDHHGLGGGRDLDLALLRPDPARDRPRRPRRPDRGSRRKPPAPARLRPAAALRTVE